MALEIRVKKTFERNLQDLVDYLDTEWGIIVTDTFLNKLWRRIDLLVLHPSIGIASAKIKGVRSVPITKHNRLFYKVEGRFLVLLLLFDNRRNPKRNRYM